MLTLVEGEFIQMDWGNDRWNDHPLFFVSVASKRFSKDFGPVVSLLFAILAGEALSIADKGLKAKVGSANWVGISAPEMRRSFELRKNLD
jgi:hypothetical protein